MQSHTQHASAFRNETSRRDGSRIATKQSRRAQLIDVLADALYRYIEVGDVASNTAQVHVPAIRSRASTAEEDLI